MKKITVVWIALLVTGLFSGACCLFGLLGIAAVCGLLLVAFCYGFYHICNTIFRGLEEEIEELADMNEYEDVAELDVPEGFYQRDFLHAMN